MAQGYESLYMEEMQIILYSVILNSPSKVGVTRGWGQLVVLRAPRLASLASLASQLRSENPPCNGDIVHHSRSPNSMDGWARPWPGRMAINSPNNFGVFCFLPAWIGTSILWILNVTLTWKSIQVTPKIGPYPCWSTGYFRCQKMHFFLEDWRCILACYEPFLGEGHFWSTSSFFRPKTF